MTSPGKAQNQVVGHTHNPTGIAEQFLGLLEAAFRDNVSYGAPCTATTWYPTCHHHSQDALGAHLHLPLFSWALLSLISLILLEDLSPAAKSVSLTLPILLANLLQGSRSTFSCASYPSFFAFQEGMWDTQISALLNSPTVSFP